MKKISVRISLIAAVFVAAVWIHLKPANVSAQGPIRFLNHINSQPLALSADDTLLAVANPDNNTVSLFDVRPGQNVRLAEVTVGTEPNGVAVSPNGSRVYVANTVSGTVTVLSIDRIAGIYNLVVATIPVGAEPYGLALTPTGGKLYVTNARSNSVSVINTSTNQVTRTITDVGIEPRGIAITNFSNLSDDQQRVFVTQFLALPVAGKLDGADDAKAGRVTVISAGTDTVIGQINLNPLADTGFRAAGDALNRIAPPAAPTPADFTFTTGAYPNQLNNIAIKGAFAYVPNTAASPNGPVRFNVNTQSFLSVINLANSTDAGQTINMHRAVATQTGTPRRFITVPWAMAFKRLTDDGYVVSAASNHVVKVRINSSTGAPTVQNDPTEPTRVLQIPTGKNPRGIVINSSDTTAYVTNYISRDVTVIDLTGNERVSATLRSANLPATGTLEDRIQIGKELYNTSIGEFDPPAAGQPAITGRMSDNGWGSCSSCHPFGLSDNVVWIFAAGPRRTVPQHVDFAPGEVNTPRVLNWSAIFDEEEDFEANIRGVSGGLGLIVGSDGITPDPTLAPFTPANGGRRQLQVRGVGAWDAIKTYVARGIRSPISPLSKTDPDVVAGRALFIDAGCQSCHGGAQWSSGQVRATPPPDASLITAGQLIAELRNVGTFDAAVRNEVRQNALAPLGAAGFNPAPLLSIFAFPQTFLHNGAADSLDAVLQNVAHRSAGTGTDRLQSAAQRQQLIRFLNSIDAASAPISPAPPTDLRNYLAASGGTTVAPDSFVSAAGNGLATQTQVGTAPNYPTTLAGTTVSIRDSAGTLRLAALHYVSDIQVNYVVPPGAAAGPATVTIVSARGATARGTVPIARVAPGLFAANGGGTGVAAATAIRVNPDNSQSPVDVFQCPTGAGSCVPVPMDLSSGPVYLTLYGTGIRNRSSLENVRCTIGGVDANVLFAGAQGQFPALDQVNVQVRASLAGRGEVVISLTVDGQTTNPVTIAVR